ncbi:hypothetical protein LVJ94_11085 [Pendulispora rubella]|uniref:Uncharacterized protein n=1 Tax=Pendulispora rubella TaxID=2741070 RepID=A0ABZ2LAI4_9BACT
MNKMMLKRFALLVPFVAAMIVAGCEIAVDFDRTKIPVDDGGATDTGVQDTSTPTDTGTDTGTDSGNDAGSDAGDAAADADAAG